MTWGFWKKIKSKIATDGVSAISSLPKIWMCGRRGTINEKQPDVIKSKIGSDLYKNPPIMTTY